MPSPVESSSPLQPTCSHIQRRYTGVTGSSRKSIIRPPTLAHRLRSDSRHLAGRVDRRPYAEVGIVSICREASLFLGARGAAQLREHCRELAILFVLWAERVERLPAYCAAATALRMSAGSGAACGNSILRLTRV